MGRIRILSVSQKKWDRESKIWPKDKLRRDIRLVKKSCQYSQHTCALNMGKQTLKQAIFEQKGMIFIKERFFILDTKQVDLSSPAALSSWERG